MVSTDNMVVVLAAGEGKRMRSSLPKVMHPLLGRTLLGHVLAAAAPLRAGRTLVVTGRGADRVEAHLAGIAPDAVPVLQEEQRGTGDAVSVALAQAPDFSGTVVVLNGDVPLLRPETLEALLNTHEDAKAAATVLAARVADPTGLGRILRDGPDGQLRQIVEERDATPAQRAIDEINAGVYAFDADWLRDALARVGTHNDQGEMYLTDVFALLVAEEQTVAVHVVDDPVQVLGVNDRAQLADLRSRLRDRVNTDWMLSGVSIVDPKTTWIDVTVRLEPDATVEPNTQLRGRTYVAAGALVGPDTTLTDVRVGAGASVVRTHGSDAEIGPRATVGPYAFLRPGTRLGVSGKIGTFVEVKNAEIGDGSKVPHLTYVGDATIGEHTNIGAATVFVNYDGVTKHRTVIGSHARTGADNMFVAPVTVGDGAYTAAGSVIVSDVPPGALGVSRAQQRNVDGWVDRRRAGTAAAEAAARARSIAAGNGHPHNGHAPAGGAGAQPAAGGDADTTGGDAGAGRRPDPADRDG